MARAPPERAHRRPTSFHLHAPRAVRALRVLFDVIVHQCSFSIAPLRLFHRVCLSVRETVTGLHYIITALKIMIRVATGDQSPLSGARVALVAPLPIGSRGAHATLPHPARGAGVPRATGGHRREVAAAPARRSSRRGAPSIGRRVSVRSRGGGGGGAAERQGVFF